MSATPAERVSTPDLRQLRMRHVKTIAVLLVALAAGCGPGRIVLAKGKITNNGKTVLVDRNNNGVLLMFHPVGDTARFYSANFSPVDDAFYVYGPEGKGIPAGKYKVVATITAPTLSPEQNTLNRRFNSLEKSPIEVEVVNAETPIDIDLSKYPPA
jgi:hypothetical protein